MPWPLLVLGYVAIVASLSDTTLENGYDTSLKVPDRSYANSPLKYYAALIESRDIGEPPENKRAISVFSRWKPLTSALNSLRPLDMNSLQALEERKYFSRSAQPTRPRGGPLRYGRR